MTTPSVPKVTPNYIRYNLRSKTLVNVKCCVCLDSVHPSYAFFCRGCDSGIVCQECMKSMPTAFNSVFVISRNTKYRANIEMFDGDNVLFLEKQLSNGSWEDNNSPKARCSWTTNTIDMEKIRAIAFITYERYQKYGYGNKHSQVMPKCPCCRISYSFLGRGYKLKSKKLHIHNVTANIHLANAIAKDLETPQDARDPTLDRELRRIKTYCAHHIDTDGFWKSRGSYDYDYGLPNINIPVAGATTGRYQEGLAYGNVAEIFNAIWVADQMGLNDDSSNAEELKKEGLELQAKVKDYTVRLAILADRPVSFSPLLKLFSTPEGRDSISTEAVLKDYVQEYIMCVSGLYTHGITASGGKAKVKALPTSVEDVMKSFSSMTADERALLAAELNAM